MNNRALQLIIKMLQIHNKHIKENFHKEGLGNSNQLLGEMELYKGNLYNNDPLHVSTAIRSKANLYHFSNEIYGIEIKYETTLLVEK